MFHIVSNLTPEVRDIFKMLWKRGEIAPWEQFPRSNFSSFQQYFVTCCWICMRKRGTRFSLRDKQLFEIREGEITSMGCICNGLNLVIFQGQHVLSLCFKCVDSGYLVYPIPLKVQGWSFFLKLYRYICHGLHIGMYFRENSFITFCFPILNLVIFCAQILSKCIDSRCLVNLIILVGI